MEMKVGFFALAVLVIAALITVKVSERAVTAGRGYELITIFSNAAGLKPKAPVELAGVEVGVVKDIELYDSRGAKVTLVLNKKVKLPADSQAVLRTRGFLGDTYVELVPGSVSAPILKSGETITDTGTSGDLNQLMHQFNQIASDIKAVTASLRTMVSEDQDAPINRIVNNLDQFTETIKELTVENQTNINRISANLAEFTEALRQSREEVEASVEHVASITRKIDQGEGTIGRLVNDAETVEKLNEAVDSLNDALGSYRKLETEIGYHTEYLTASQDLKHYVSLDLKPSPDKAFMLDIVADPNPNPQHVERTTDVTVNDTTTTVQTHTATIDRSAIRISAQLAKKFYDFQIRGGIIESTGGVGADYFMGPFTAHVDAYDFSTRYGERPHIKLTGEVNVTKNFFVMGGADDIINKQQSVDYFFGGGFRLVDEDIKSLFKLGGASSLLGN
jgi:phospholipid/cholesterol/gamma-HCH transport system substrate-binding protein